MTGDFRGFNKAGFNKNKGGGKNELLVHRIPHYCTAEQIQQMIVAASHCVPLQVAVSVIGM